MKNLVRKSNTKYLNNVLTLVRKVRIGACLVVPISHRTQLFRISVQVNINKKARTLPESSFTAVTVRISQSLFPWRSQWPWILVGESSGIKMLPSVLFLKFLEAFNTSGPFTIFLGLLLFWNYQLMMDLFELQIPSLNPHPSTPQSQLV